MSNIGDIVKESPSLEGILRNVKIKIPAYSEHAGLAKLTIETDEGELIELPYFGKIRYNEIREIKNKRVSFTQRAKGFISRYFEQKLVTDNYIGGIENLSEHKANEILKGYK